MNPLVLIIPIVVIALITWALHAWLGVWAITGGVIVAGGVMLWLLKKLGDGMSK